MSPGFGEPITPGPTEPKAKPREPTGRGRGRVRGGGRSERTEGESREEGKSGEEEGEDASSTLETLSFDPIKRRLLFTRRVARRIVLFVTNG